MKAMNKIKEVRKAVGITQKEACERIGVPRRTWENWESEKLETYPAAWIENLIIEKLESFK